VGINQGLGRRGGLKSVLAIGVRLDRQKKGEGGMRVASRWEKTGKGSPAIRATWLTLWAARDLRGKKSGGGQEGEVALRPY